MAVDRRVQWLGATVIVAVLAVMAGRSGSETPPSAPTRGRANASRAAAASPESATAVDVNLDALKKERDRPADATRDPFRFRPRPAPAAPPAATRIPGVQDDQVGAPPPPPRVPAGPPPPPPITLKFIGLVQKADGTKYAVLSDGKGPPISGTEGQEVEGRFKILKIGTESMEIAYIDGRGRTTIRLTGQ